MTSEFLLVILEEHLYLTIFYFHLFSDLNWICIRLALLEVKIEKFFVYIFIQN